MSFPIDYDEDLAWLLSLPDPSLENEGTDLDGQLQIPSEVMVRVLVNHTPMQYY